MWTEYKWMLCQTRNKDGTRQNFDYAISIHKSKAQALTARLVHLRWHKLDPDTLYIQETP
jgi:hypothetical protein